MSVTTGTFPGVRIVDMPDLGAVSDAVSVVAEHAGSGRVTAPALRSYVMSSAVNQTETGHFYSNQGGRINRLADRALIGGALDNAATYPPSGATWVAAEAGGWMTYLDEIAQLEVISTIGGAAATFAARTSDNNNTVAPAPVFDGAFGTATYVLNDHATVAHSAWGHYTHVVNNSAVSLATFCAELDIANRRATVDMDPYAATPAGITGAIWLANGGETAQNGISVNPASVAIGIISDGPRNALVGTGALYNKGIVFQADCLVGADGATLGGNATAIELALGHQLVWRYSAGPNANGGVIRSDNNNANTQTRLVFGPNEFVVAGVKSDLMTEIALLSVLPNQAAVNHLRVEASATAQPLILRAIGSDTDIDIELVPKGSGVLRMGNLSAAASVPANFTADRYFAIKDGSGTEYFVPCKATGW